MERTRQEEIKPSEITFLFHLSTKIIVFSYYCISSSTHIL
jgi:hypothetical protein